MNISNRLLEITKFVPENSIVADIGADHGIVPVYLIKNNKSKKVIATDISKPSLEKTVSYVKDLGLEDRIDTRLGNGLEVIKAFEVDTVIFAGMGGVLIEKLLEKDKEVANSINNFIFQPMIGADELRKYLYTNNFKIVEESLIKEDGKFYELIFAKRGLDYIEDDIYYDLGKKLIEDRHPLLKDFIEYKINYKNYVLDKMDLTSGSEKIIKREKYLKGKINKYKEVLDSIC